MKETTIRVDLYQNLSNDIFYAMHVNPYPHFVSDFRNYLIFLRDDICAELEDQIESKYTDDEKNH